MSAELRVWADEELRVGGWTEEEVASYRAGVASAEARFAEWESRPAPEASDPVPASAPSETEIRVLELAALFVAQSDRADEVRAEAHREELMRQTTAVVTRPGDPEPVADVRSRALAYIARDGLITCRPGPHNAPQQFAVQLPDGLFHTFTAGALPEMTVIRPETADQQLAEWEWAARRREDQMLIAEWGLDECQRAGVLMTGATDAGEYAKLVLPAGVKAL
jgi:hypothetical protein